MGGQACFTEEIFKVITEDVSINGIVMSYARFGSGEKVFVIIPGLSVSKVTPNARAVERQYSEAAKNHAVYLFDRRDNVPEKYNVHDIAEDTASVMKHLGIEKACVLGVSQGGMIAMDMAINHPELVSRLILCVTCAYLNGKLKESISYWRTAAESGDSLVLNKAFVNRLFSQKLLERSGEALASVMPKYSEETFGSFIKALDNLECFDLRAELHKIVCPVYVIGAENDAVMGAGTSEELAHQLGCEYYIYPEYAHGVYDEAPDFAKRAAEIADKNF